MTTRTTVMKAWFLLGSALIACPLFGRDVAASDHRVTVTVHVSTHGMDLSRPTDLHKFYRLLQQAALVVCTHGNRAGLEPVDDRRACREKALGDAIRSANSPLLTQIYLATHTLEEAAAFGIDVPAQVAAK